MATQFSPNLRLSLPADGESDGLWGGITNKNLGTLIESAIGGVATVSVTNADVTLTSELGEDDQSRHMVLELVGASTGSRSVIVPAAEKVYIVANLTTGGFAHTIRQPTGGGISVPNGSSVIVYCNGSVVRSAVTSVGGSSGGGSSPSGQTLMVAGSSSAPGLAFSVETNTGLFRPAAGSLSVAISGSAVSTFSSSGFQASSLSVAGSTTHTGPVTNASTMSTTGVANFSAAANFFSSVSVSGALASGPLTVSGVSSFSGNMNVTGNVTYSGVARKSGSGIGLHHSNAAFSSSAVTISSSAPSSGSGSDGDIWLQTS